MGVISTLRRWLFLGLALLATTCISADVLNTEPGNPPDMRGKPLARLPKGFHIELIKMEPDIQQPVAMCFDFQGRLWIAECYSHGRQPVTKKDRILYFEDTTGDGEYDTRRIFTELNGDKTTSVAVGMGGVWVISVPELLFFPDADYDGIPDGKPMVMLDGWVKGKGSQHTLANGLFWGPDGWLYGRSGINSISNVGLPGSQKADRTPLSCGTWRFHPTRKTFELVTRGTTNPWGMDYDQHGQMFFINTVIAHLWHMVPEVYHKRMHTKPMRPHMYELVSSFADHVHWATEEKWQDAKKELTDATDAAGGGHAHAGLMIYQGDNWPAEYRHVIHALNLHGRRINRDTLKRLPQTTGYTSSHLSDMSFFLDPWFRGVDLKYGPDGSVYVIDFSDNSECHDFDLVHRTSGRLYRIHYGKKPRWHGNLTQQSSEELVQLQHHANAWFARKARLLLQERAHLKQQPMLKTHEPLKQLLHAKVATPLRLRALWSLNLTQGLNEAALFPLLQDSDEHIRLWALRCLVNEKHLNTPLNQFLASHYQKEPSKLVRLFMVSMFRHLPLKERLRLAVPFSQDPTLNHDPQYPNLLWTMIEEGVASHPESLPDLFLKTKLPKLQTWIAKRIAHQKSHPERLNLIFKLLPQIENETTLSGIAQQLLTVHEIRAHPEPGAFQSSLAHIKANHGEATYQAYHELMFRFSDVSASKLSDLAKSPHAKLQLRKEALQLLAKRKDARKMAINAALQLLELQSRPLAEDEMRSNAAMKTEALAVLNKLKHPDFVDIAVNHLLTAHPSKQDQERIAALFTRKSDWAHGFLDAIQAGKIPLTALSASHAQKISLMDKKLAKRVSDIWGTITPSSKETRDRIKSIIHMVKRKHIGNRERGASLFAQTCGSCHEYLGQGGQVGPSLTSTSTKNLYNLLHHILDPNAIVPEAYKLTMVTLKDGRTLSGFTQPIGKEAIEIRNSSVIERINLASIKSMTKLNQSVMPQGLLNHMSDQQIVDLIKYLTQ